MSEGGQNNPWAWLGLLKWSLSYSDGTTDSSASPMSEEDKAFLEKVMKDGIIDENERMKTILKQVTAQMTDWRETQWKEEEEQVTNDLLQELRDCVEQIDYARSFAAMKGLEFLLGCVQERERIPKSTRGLCLGILATMSNNNPPVQKQLLELGALKTLSELFFAEEAFDFDGKLRARCVQAISAVVRSHELAESVFCQLEQSPSLIMAGLGMGKESEYSLTPQPLRQRSLFLLRALVTSDAVSAEAVKPFAAAIGWVADYMVDPAMESSGELREMALAMLRQVLEQGKIAHTLEHHKAALVSRGVRRIAALRALTGEEREFAATELEDWEALLVLLARS